MTKQQRRDEIKRVYPLACAGIAKAIADLKNLMHPKSVRGKCVICGIPILTWYPEAGRCQAHMKRRLYMRETITEGTTA